VWFEILTPKQILFYKPVMDILRAAGHEVLATSRRFREVEPLAKMHNLRLTYVGERGGRDPREQLAASLERQQKLLPLVEEFRPDVSVSTGSADCARISFGLRIKHLAVNDSPHSVVAGKLSLPLSFHLMTPWVIPYSDWSVYGITRRMITRYRALDPAAWLKRAEQGTLELPLDPDKRTITVRVEESYAPYMIGSDGNWAGTVLLRIAKEFANYNLVALCRYDQQLTEVKERFGASFIIPEHVIDGTALLRATDLFVGMGGTMTAEAALMGIPTISAFQRDYTVERYLVSKGLVTKARSPEQISKLGMKLMHEEVRTRISSNARRLLKWMEDPAQKIANLLERIDISD
jgi:predicted glycosyltransferase